MFLTNEQAEAMFQSLIAPPENKPALTAGRPQHNALQQDWCAPRCKSSTRNVSGFASFAQKNLLDDDVSTSQADERDTAMTASFSSHGKKDWKENSQPEYTRNDWLSTRLVLMFSE